MDDQNQNISTPVADTVAPEPRHAVGPLVGAGIVIALIILGGLYFWGAKLNQMEVGYNEPAYIPGDDEVTPTQEVSDAVIDQTAAAAISAALPTQSTSDDTSDIEADFKAMDINGLTSQTAGDVSAFGTAAQ
jgi:hypothetical protein